METLKVWKQRGGVEHEQAAPLLRVEDLTVRFGGLRAPGEAGYALRYLSFRVDEGERVAVVGPNGAGKSTLFKVIAGTLEPQRGQIHISGHGPDRHICIAYVPQRSDIDWRFPVTVADVVMMGRVGQIGLFRNPRRGDWALVRASLERVRAGHLYDRQIGELSGGQQQRVFIARALAQQAELLLLDEPFTGLDVPGQEAIIEILDDLAEEGITLLVATHDLNLAAAHFDRVMLLNQEIVHFGPPEQSLTAEMLVRAYGGHMHRVQDGAGSLVLTDTCCDG